MEWLKNTLYRIEWKLRRALNTKNQLIYPIQWSAPRLTAAHGPSEHFRRSLDDENCEKLRLIMREVEVMSRLSPTFPRRISDSDWKRILECGSRKQRLDQLIFLHRNERIREKEKLKKMEKRAEKTRVFNEYGLLYRPSEYEKTHQWMNVLRSFLQNSPTLVVDCQFLDKLSVRGRELTGSQLKYIISENRELREPFRLYFANFDVSSRIVQDIQKSKLQGIHRISPIVTDQCFSQIFDKQRIIYLSPDADETLETVDDDKVYVIGGIVDRVVEPEIEKHASKMASERAAVKCAKIPLDQYMEFKSGSKFLTLIAVMKILHEVNQHGNWARALKKCVPMRNQRSAEEKNPVGRDLHKKYREYNKRVIKLVENELGY
ncbi:unnamed protein product [Caenorhabditis bovis]|uniref:RNA (guanine-9-)-methyltransferase domain-containing protein 1 n=1 Tax=Caenorhabditis bovis TaxID=2654633 RepID=A0A8S1F7L1_9PELO|nr:unnamed protein product [Caenorhabditis bovis]